MSTTQAARPDPAVGPQGAPRPLGAGPGGRRVRHEARDQVALMAFSALASCLVALLLLLLVRVTG